jgi:hypothetical protein
MNGLEEIRSTYRQRVVPLLQSEFPDLRPRIAAGLVGEGSECFGFDDALSRDHDWSAACCLWLEEDDFNQWGERLQAAVDRQLGEAPPSDRPETAGRRGVLETDRFYARFLGRSAPPSHWREWIVIPETYLAACTNGEVFDDPLGAFSRQRQALLAFYPDDVRLHKLARRCTAAAQSGQYNFPRSLRRGDQVAARLAQSRFITEAMATVFLLNRRYCPFYKWMHRALRDLPRLGAPVHRWLEELVRGDPLDGCPACPGRQAELVEMICAALREELRRQDLSDAAGDFLLDHGPSIQARIADPEIRRLPIVTP